MARLRAYALAPQLFFWLPSLYIVLHTLEELPNFGAWATAHFGTHTTFVFATTHIPILLLVFLASYKASQIGKHSGWVIFVAAWQIQFALNAVFHLTTAALFWEYSPGMVVAGSLGFVLTYYVVGRMMRERRLTGKELAWAALWGVAMAAIGVGTLFLG